MSPGVGEIPKKEFDIYAISKNKHVGVGFSLKMETFVGWEVRGIKCDNWHQLTHNLSLSLSTMIPSPN